MGRKLMAEAGGLQMKRALFAIAKLALGIALIAVLYRSNREAFEKAFSAFRLEALPLLVFSGLLFILSVTLLAMRQLTFLKPLGLDSDFRKMFHFAYGGSFANMFLPAGTGYDMLRILHFKSQASLSSVMGWILVDKLVGFAGLASLCFMTVNAGLLWNGSWSVRVFAADVALAISCVLALSLVFSGAGRRLTGMAVRALPRAVCSESVLEFLDTLKSYSRMGGRMALTLFLSFSSHLLAVIAVGAIGFAVGGWTVGLLMVFYAPVVMLSSMVPLSPGNLGWTETVAAGVGYVAGSPDALTVFILWRIVCLLASLGGAFSLFFVFKPERAD